MPVKIMHHGDMRFYSRVWMSKGIPTGRQLSSPHHAPRFIWGNDPLKIFPRRRWLHMRDMQEAYAINMRRLMPGWWKSRI